MIKEIHSAKQHTKELSDQLLLLFPEHNQYYATGATLYLQYKRGGVEEMYEEG